MYTYPHLSLSATMDPFIESHELPDRPATSTVARRQDKPFPSAV